ncbi:MAG: diguanylate cyclase [Lachnospiraceae bacterium]|nr:diguanylate cyclase [Lachnospiraceae bacterium]
MKKLPLESKKLLLIVYGICIALVLLTVVKARHILAEATVGQPSIAYEGMSGNSMTAVNDGWWLADDNGGRTAVTLPTVIESEGPVTLYHEAAPFRGRALVMKASRDSYELFAGEQRLAHLNATELSRQLRYRDTVILPISDQFEGNEVRLVLSHSENGAFEVPELWCGDLADARYSVLLQEWITIFLMLVLISMGVIILMAAIVLSAHHRADMRILDLFSFLILAVCWGFGDSALPSLFGIPLEMAGFICYLSLMLMPVPICRFLYNSMDKEGRVFPFWTWIFLGNMILQLVLSNLGLVPLHRTLIVTHSLYIAFTITGLIHINQLRRKRKDITVLFVGLIVLGATGIGSLAAFGALGDVGYRTIYLTGLIFFIVTLFVSIMIHYMESITEHEKALEKMRVQERLAYYDAMTGLQNRRGFERLLAEIDEMADEYELRDDHPNTVLVMMDVNGLKHTNDTYGHAAGDELVVTAANMIKAVFGEEADCFRIGGDEFAVIFKDMKKDLSAYKVALEEAMATDDPKRQWHLSMACGASYLFSARGDRMTLSDWKMEADIRMYRQKVTMSEGHRYSDADGLKDIIDCIVTTLEAKDDYTASHSKRVCRISLCIGQRMGLSPVTLEELKNAAYLHDIGKVGIPDNILMKPSGLTDREFREMQKHAGIGADIVGRARGFAEVSQIIRHHHERWDGNGYPAGLSGADIPLCSRIIAVADSIDAMTSRRVYRGSLPIEECRLEIEKNSGRMYDPAIVSITMESWHEIKDIIMLHPNRFARDNREKESENETDNV